jgi:hypothetical protein
MPQIDRPRAYQLPPDMEAEIVWLLCTSQTFWTAIGQHVQADSFDSEARRDDPTHRCHRYLVRAATSLGTETSRAPQKMLYVITYLRSHAREWKLRHEEVVAIEEYAAQLDERMTFLEPDEKVAIQILLPELRSHATQQLAAKIPAVYSLAPEEQEKRLRAIAAEVQNVIQIGHANESQIPIEVLEAPDDRAVESAIFMVTDLDRISEPYEAGKLGMVIAPASGGKSSFLNQIGTALTWQKYHGLYISYEDSRDLIIRRHLSAITRIPFRLFKPVRGETTTTARVEAKRRLEHLYELQPDLGRMRIARYSKHRETLNHIEEEIDRTEQRTGQKLKFLLVDYIDQIGDTAHNGETLPVHMTIRRNAEGLAELAARRGMFVWSGQQTHEENDPKKKKKELDLSTNYAKARLGNVYGGKAAIKAADIVIGISVNEDQSLFSFVTSKNRDGVARAKTDDREPDYPFGCVGRLDTNYAVRYLGGTDYQEGPGGQSTFW